MDYNKRLKSFDCPIHHGEKIVRISKDPSIRKRLYCVECIIEVEKTGRKPLISLERLIDEVHGYLASVEEAKTNIKPPNDLVNILYDEEHLFSTLSNNIQAQKMKINTEIKKIEEAIVRMLEKTRERIYMTLDNQLEIFKKNYSDYRDLMRRYFNYENKKRIISKEELLDDFNRCQTPQDLEVKLNFLFGELDEINRSLDDFKRGLMPSSMENLRSMKNNLMDHFENFPESFAISEKYFRAEYQNMLDQLQEFLGHLLRYTSPLAKFMQHYEMNPQERFYFGGNSDRSNTNNRNVQDRGSYERLNHVKSVNNYDNYISPVDNFASKTLDYSPTSKRGLGGSVPSRIINAMDIRALEEWMGARIISTSLLYRATRDGFELNKILEAFNPKSSVLILIKTSNNEIIGCYRDKPRNPTVTEKFDTYFTFSLTEGKKVDEGYAFADLSAFDIGNCFISNSLFLVSNSHISEGSYCVLQEGGRDNRGKYSFDFENKAINYFLSTEIEVLQLEIGRNSYTGVRTLSPRRIGLDY